MTHKLSTRIATQSDTNILANLYLASRKEYISFAPLVHSDAAIQHWMHDILVPGTQVWVVEENGVINGTTLSRSNFVSAQQFPPIKIFQ